MKQLKEEGIVKPHQDRFAQAAGEWTGMTFGERIPYENMAAADKERHQKDLDIATRNLNAALLGSVQKHGARNPCFFRWRIPFLWLFAPFFSRLSLSLTGWGHRVILSIWVGLSTAPFAIPCRVRLFVLIGF